MANSLLKSEKVLVALKDKNSAMEFIEKWREHFPTGELQFNFVEDGLKAVQEAKFTSPALAIIDDHLPSKNGVELANALLQSYGQIQILLVSSEDLSASSFPALKTPITDWTQATHLMASLLPGDFLQENNIQLGDPILVGQLKQYALKYQEVASEDIQSPNFKPQVLNIFINSAPSFSKEFHSPNSPLSGHLNTEKSPGSSPAESLSRGTSHEGIKQFDPKTSLSDFQVMMGEIIVIALVSINLGWIGLPAEEDLFLMTTFKFILMGLLGFSVLGFFTLRLTKKKREI